MIGFYFGGLAISVIALYILLKLNRLTLYKNRVTQGWEGVDVLLNKRYELFDELVRLMKHRVDLDPELEREFARKRVAASHAFTVGEQQKTEHELLLSVNKVLTILSKDAGFSRDSGLPKLLKEISGTGLSIRNASHYYNGTVQEYNRQLRKSSKNLLVRLAAFREINSFNPEPLHIPEQEGVGVW